MMAPSETSVQTTNVQKTDTSRSMGVKVTTKTESTGIADNLELNPWYFKTVPGILKLVQLVSAFSFCFVFAVLRDKCLKRGRRKTMRYKYGCLQGMRQGMKGNCISQDFKFN